MGMGAESFFGIRSDVAGLLETEATPPSGPAGRSQGISRATSTGGAGSGASVPRRIPGSAPAPGQDAVNGPEAGVAPGVESVRQTPCAGHGPWLVTTRL